MGCYGSITKSNKSTMSHCVALRSCYRTLHKHYRALWNVTGRYGTSWSVMEHYGTLHNVTERYRGIVETLCGVAEHCGTLRSIAGRYGALWNCQEKYRLCPYGTECTRPLHVLAVQCPLQSSPATQLTVCYDPPPQTTQLAYIHWTIAIISVQ